MSSKDRYLRVALFGDPGSERESISRRLKSTLESQGHTVFWFSPKLHPYAFARKGVVRGYMVRRFFRVQKLDCVLMADGIALDYPETAREAAGAPIGFVCESAEQFKRGLENSVESEGWLPDFVLACGEEVNEALKADGRLSRVYAFDPGTEGDPLGIPRDELALRGCQNPRSIACVFGYIGTDNFANEHILTTIEERLRERVEGSSIVAISLNPRHTLEHRGIYPLSMKDKHALDAALAYTSVVMVIAGLLNDNGVRWGMGKAEVVANPSGCDLCSIAALSMMAKFEDAKMVLYGGGAGPLELIDSRKLIAFMAKLDASFIARDEGSAEVLQTAGVPDCAISLGADPALLGSCAPTQVVDKWLAERHIDTSVSQVLAVTLRSGEGFAPDFPQRVVGVLKRALAERPQLRVVLCAMDPGDASLLDKVKAGVGNAERVNIFHAGFNVETLGDLLARVHAGFSMQYYSTLVLMRSGIPCMSVACQLRESALFAETGCEELSLGADATEDEMLSTLFALLDGREGWAERVGEAMAGLRARALKSEDYVVEQIGAIGKSKAFEVVLDSYPHEASASDREHEREIAKLEARIHQANEEIDRAYREKARYERRLGTALTAIPRKLGFMKDEGQ